VRGRAGAVIALVLLGACSGEPAALTGEELAADVGCVSCHTAEDTRLAPTWHGLFGEEVTLEDGTTVTADEAYLRRAILEPEAEVVEGYRPTMPRFELTPEEVDDLVSYIAGLGP
jgi:cytochrome c oxidase subunit II